MKLSVVIPCHNAYVRLGPTLDHLLASNIGSLDAIEVIVVDDGSLIPIEPVVRERKNARKFLISCLRQTNAGPATARNTGFRVSQGEVVLFIDDDILVSPDLLLQHVEAHRTHPKSVIFGRCPLARLTPPGPLLRYLESRGFDADDDAAEEFIETDVIASGQISFERAMFECGQGIYRDDLITPAAEEYELSARLRARRIPILLATRIIAAHNQRVSLDSICQQAFKHAMGCAEVAVKYPSTLNICALRKIMETNQPPTRGEPAGLLMKKAIKKALAGKYPYALLVGITNFTERVAPKSSLLFPLYNAVIGLRGFSGVRSGLRRFGREAPNSPS